MRKYTGEKPITKSVFDSFDVIGDIAIAEAVVIFRRITPKVTAVLRIVIR